MHFRAAVGVKLPESHPMKKMETDTVMAKATEDSTLINVSNDVAMRDHNSLKLR